MKAHRILLVEEECAERSGRAASLLQRGYEVQTAADVQEATASCRQAMPHLVLVGLRVRPEQPSAIVAALRSNVPGVRIAILMHKSHRLCAVGLDGTTLIGAESPADFLRRVEIALA